MEDMPIAEGIIGPILTILVIVAITLFLLVLWNWYNSNQKEQATLNNFEELFRRIESLEQGEEVFHPIYLDDDNTIFGFEKDKDIISGSCEWKIWKLELPTAWGKIQKPDSCENKGCLCLCKQKYFRIKDKCEDTICKPSKFSITGGEVDSGKYCDFAMVSGGEVRNIYLKREGLTVKVCADKCT